MTRYDETFKLPVCPTMVLPCHHLYGILRHVRPRARLTKRAADRLIGVMRFAAAAQNCGVAGFQAERGCIGGHIGPRFIDDADDPEWNAHSSDLEPIRPPPHLDHFMGFCRN